jgi:mono/diheme cytochrome c family protein
MLPVEFLLCLTITAPGAEPAPDPGARARAVFVARCAGCHGPDVPKPKGRINYVTDLAKLANNRELVIPGEPDQSELWVVVRRGEMPPTDSPRGPLSDVEKETIRAWIAAGAPDVAHPTTQDLPTLLAPPASVFPALGKFHLLMLHFPIALALAAAFAELLAWRWPASFTQPARFCLWLAALFAIPTVVLGWVFATEGHGSGDLLPVHAWLGTGAATWLLLTVLAYEWALRRGAGNVWVRVMVLLGAALTATAAHFGGLLVWGPRFFG